MPGSVPLGLCLDTAGVQVPWYFRCPISLELMRDPVTVSTGQTYDRASIESWVATGNTTCPVTRAALADFTLIPNHTLRRLIQEWCVAHRSMGVERIPTPKQPADPDLVRSLVAQGPGLPALRRLRALARESDKNRLVMATHETRAALVEAAFGSGSGAASEELETEAMAVLALVGLGEAEAAEVVGREERVARLGKVLGGGGPLEARVNAGAVVEALQAEAVRAGAMGRLLLMVQGGCSERAKRKAQHLLKLLRSAWPSADCVANSDDFLQHYHY